MSSTLTLPTLESEYALSPELIAQYRDRGHVLLRGVLNDAELCAFRREINEAADQFNTETRPLEERDTYGKAFLQIMNLWNRHEGVRAYTLARRFAKIAADLMGVSGVRIYHDQALFKEPGGGPTPWHQDQHYWPLDTDQTITLWMPLIDLPAHIGSMTFADGSNRLGYLGDIPISDDSERIIAELIKEKGFSKTHYGAMKAGDATFHSGWTLHGAPGNPTPHMREVMTVIYYADGTKVKAPENASQRSDHESWLSSAPVGEIAASELNPLVYSRS